MTWHPVGIKRVLLLKPSNHLCNGPTSTYRFNLPCVSSKYGNIFWAGRKRFSIFNTSKVLVLFRINRNNFIDRPISSCIPNLINMIISGSVDGQFHKMILNIGNRQIGNLKQTFLQPKSYRLFRSSLLFDKICSPAPPINGNLVTSVSRLGQHLESLRFGDNWYTSAGHSGHQNASDTRPSHSLQYIVF